MRPSRLTQQNTDEAKQCNVKKCHCSMLKPTILGVLFKKRASQSDSIQPIVSCSKNKHSKRALIRVVVKESGYVAVCESISQAFCKSQYKILYTCTHFMPREQLNVS